MPIIGGRNQKRKAAEIAATARAPNQDTAKFDSGLAKNLIDQWVWGKCSAASVQRTAKLSYDDAAIMCRKAGVSTEHIPKSLRALAELGNHGNSSGNVNRDLITWLGEPCIPPPFRATINVQIAKPAARAIRFILGVDAPGLRQPVKFSFLLPHVIFNTLFWNSKSTFITKFIGDGGLSPTCTANDKLEQFWQTVVQRRDPRIIRHPMCTRRDWQRWAIPVAIHGDAVPVVAVGKAGTKSLDCMSWQSLLSSGKSLVTKILICSIFEQNKLRNNQTENELWNVITWSLIALFEGKFPSKPHDSDIEYGVGSADAALAGAPLCSSTEPFFCVLWSVKGDLDWLFKSLHLPSYNANKQCPYCPSDKAGPLRLKPTYTQPDADWIPLQYEAAEWRRIFETKHVLFSKLTYLSGHNIESDELHILHLGTSQYFLGSILWLIVFKIFPGTPQDNADELWKLVREYYALKKTSTQFTSLGLNSFTNMRKIYTEYPKLKGKGCEVKGSVAAVLWLWKRKVVEANPWYRNVLDALEALNRMQGVLDDHRYDCFIPLNVCRVFAADCDVFLAGYTRLGLQADAALLLLFTAAPKLHWLWHMSRRARFLNPRRVACFIDEDFVGRMKTLAVRCTASTKLHNVPATLMQKYRWGLHLQFRDDYVAE
jgi:hypothetical protein